MAGQCGLDPNPRGGFGQQGVRDELEERQAGGRVAHLHRPPRHQPVSPHVRHEVEGEGCARAGGNDLSSHAGSQQQAGGGHARTHAPSRP